MNVEKKEGDQGEDRNKKRLLIVDDEADIILSFSLALEDSGLFVVDTYNDSSGFVLIPTKLLCSIAFKH